MYQLNKENKVRLCGYADRILYTMKRNDKIIELIPLPDEYVCHIDAIGSDHKPISHKFILRNKQLEENPLKENPWILDPMNAPVFSLRGSGKSRKYKKHKKSKTQKRKHKKSKTQKRKHKKSKPKHKKSYRKLR